jgi:hypothetical protein
LKKRQISAYAGTPAFYTQKKEGVISMKNMKRNLVIALMVLAMITACAPKYDAETDFEAKPIDGGKGVEITKYVGDKFEVRIPPKIQKLPVIRIGNFAFDEKSFISVIIPNSVTSIGDGAFSECTSLTSITIPNNVTSIGQSAFSGCTSLANVTISDSVTSIGDYAFFGCISLTSVPIPESVTTIGSSVFTQQYDDLEFNEEDNEFTDPEFRNFTPKEIAELLEKVNAGEISKEAIEDLQVELLDKMFNGLMDNDEFTLMIELMKWSAEKKNAEN